MGEEQWKALPGLPGCVPAADWPIHRSCRSRCPGLESRQPGKAQHGRAGTFLSLIRTSPIWPNREKRHRVSWCSRYFRALTFGWVRFRVERENLPKKQKKTPQIKKKKKKSPNSTTTVDFSFPYRPSPRSLPLPCVPRISPIRALTLQTPDRIAWLNPKAAPV